LDINFLPFRVWRAAIYNRKRLVEIKCVLEFFSEVKQNLGRGTLEFRRLRPIR
jgi:hypothetical protein